MAIELNDLMAMKNIESGLSPYEQYKVGYMQTKNHTSGIGVAGLVLGTVGTAAAIGAWIFGPTYANARANQAREAAQSAKETATLLASSNQRQLDQLTNLFAAERNERIAGDVTLNQTITDTVSGSQQGTLTAQQAAEEWVERLSAIKWKNYLTASEAEQIVSAMKPAAPWKRDVWRQAMESLGLETEDKPYYNSCALWTVMNMVYSDSSETLAKIMGSTVNEIESSKMVKAVYELALDKLEDEDGRFNVRRYFGLA